jgi:hypothetical protein
MLKLLGNRPGGSCRLHWPAAFSHGFSVFAQSIKGLSHEDLVRLKKVRFKVFKIVLFALNFNIKNCKQAASRKLDRNCRVFPVAYGNAFKGWWTAAGHC